MSQLIVHMGNAVTCDRDTAGPYQLHIRPIGITNIPIGRCAQIRVKMPATGQATLSTKDTIAIQVLALGLVLHRMSQTLPHVLGGTAYTRCDTAQP